MSRNPANSIGGVQQAAQWLPPGIGPKFDRAVEGLPVTKDFVFGTAAVPTPGVAASVAVKSPSDLAGHWQPLPGVYNDAGVHVGGTGSTVIAAQCMRYREDFTDSNVFAFATDHLNLKSYTPAGAWSSYLRGQIQAPGFTANVGGGTTATPIAALGLVAGDMSLIEVGDVTTVPGYGLAAVAAKNVGAQTLTFDALTCGAGLTNSTANYHITFTKMGYAPLAADVVNGTTATLSFSRPLPSSVVPGSFVLGIRRAAEAWHDPQAQGFARVATIASDRLSCSLTEPARFVNNCLVASGSGVLFLPQTWAGGLCSRFQVTPNKAGTRGVVAIRVEWSLPVMGSYENTAGLYAKAEIDAAIAGNPTVLWGHWPAVWTYGFGANDAGNAVQVIDGGRSPWSEIDFPEFWVMPAFGGTRGWTGNLHDQPYTRKRSLSNGAGGASRIAGASWHTEAATTKELTPNATKLVFPASLFDGQKHSTAIVWTRDKVVHYYDDVPLCESDWHVDSDFNHQLQIQNQIGSLAGYFPTQLFFPQSQGHADGMYVKVHRVQVWEA